MKDVIRENLRGLKELERACKNARSETRKYGINAGRVINRVVAYWKENENTEALEVAKWGDNEAKAKHPDIKCILGRAYLRVDPSEASLADAAFRSAHSLGCNREELLRLWIEAKMILGDWKGVIDITRLADKSGAAPFADNVFNRARAFRELGAVLERTGNFPDALARLHEGAEEISKAFFQHRAHGRVQELKELQTVLYLDYIHLLENTTSATNSFEVWNAVCEAFDHYCRRSFLFRTGLQSLQRWWRHVEGERADINRNTANKMSDLLDSISSYRKRLIEVQWPDSDLMDQMDDTHANLSQRLREYELQFSDPSSTA